ncbi:Pectinesterase 1 [Nymphaea thermarum]|nr:Pectinesterase 1 [Nymphaea thermarum]
MRSATLSIRIATTNPLPPPPASPLPHSSSSHLVDGSSDSRKLARSPDEKTDPSCPKVMNSTLLVFIALSVVLFALLHIFFYGDSSSTAFPSQRYHQPLPAAMATRKSISAGDVLNNSCSVTLYPEFCLSSLSHLPGVRGAVTEKEFLMSSVMEAARLAKKAFIKFDGILVREGKRRSKRRRGAINDCIQMMDMIISNLGAVLSRLVSSPSGHKQPPSAKGSSLFSWHENEVKEYLSAAKADHDTCMNSLEKSKATMKHLNDVKKRMDPINKMVSNSLSIVNDLVAKEEVRLAGGETDIALFPATTNIPRATALAGIAAETVPKMQCLLSFGAEVIRWLVKHLNDVKKRMDPINKMVSNSLSIVNDLVAKEEVRLAGGETDIALFPATTNIPRATALAGIAAETVPEMQCLLSLAGIAAETVPSDIPCLISSWINSRSFRSTHQSPVTSHLVPPPFRTSLEWEAPPPKKEILVASVMEEARLAKKALVKFIGILIQCFIVASDFSKPFMDVWWSALATLKYSFTSFSCQEKRDEPFADGGGLWPEGEEPRWLRTAPRLEIIMSII